MNRRRFRWWWVYLALVIASFVAQRFGAGLPDWSADMIDGQVQVPRMTDAGPTDGQPVTIGYRAYGNPNADETVILLHGSPNPMPSFTEFGPMLGQHYRVLAPDMPGTALSTRYVPDYGIVAYSHYLTAFMDELDIQRAHLFGFSLGSGVAMHAADRQPQRVESLTLFGGIGIQEGEGTGDYFLEHLKYNVGYAVYVVGFELVPHFGFLGTTGFRHAFLRNFIDTDQRPLRDLLQRINQREPKLPMLILHGVNDPLVPAWAARQHHAIVEHSELVMFDDSHFMLFDPQQARQVADATIDFIDRTNRSDYTPARRTDDPYAADAGDVLNPLQLQRGMNPWWQMLLIAGGTFVSEDLTCISVGMLISIGELDLFLGVFAAFVGIFLGDIGLWLAGYFGGRRALNWKPVKRWLPAHTLDGVAAWYDKFGFFAVFASRFMPGTRLPLYVTAGVLGRRASRFIGWALISDLIYTPLVVILIAVFGEVVAEPLRRYIEHTWMLVAIAALVVFLAIRITVMLCSTIGRGKLMAQFSRLWRWEFWPGWLFYAPLVPWFAYLALRYKGVSTFTAANPALPQSGVVGESKHDILRRLPDDAIVPSALVVSTEPEQRIAAARKTMADRGWSYPLILKPDAAQRGAGLKRISNDEQLAAYMRDTTYPVLLQTYHPGPYEAGIFYIRHPDEQVGRICSITDKHFPQVVGNGKHTLHQLIWRHPRYRMQARLFLHRHDDELERVLAEGERFTLAVAGNHCQGTKFIDGARLITPELTQRIDAIAKSIPGFYFGRFDVRYRDADAFQRGQDLAIVELNGVSSESTNLYDPTHSIWRAYRILFTQWHEAFRIGTANRARGHEPMGWIPLVKLLHRYYRDRDMDELSD